MYSSNHIFHKCHNIKKFDNLSFKSKYSFLIEFFNDLEKFLKQNKKTRRAASELYNELLKVYFDEYNDVSDAKRKMNSKYNPTNLRLDAYDYEEWFKGESNNSTLKGDEKEELCDVPPLEGDKRKRKGLKS